MAFKRSPGCYEIFWWGVPGASEGYFRREIGAADGKAWEEVSGGIYLAVLYKWNQPCDAVDFNNLVPIRWRGNNDINECRHVTHTRSSMMIILVVSIFSIKQPNKLITGSLKWLDNDTKGTPWSFQTKNLHILLIVYPSWNACPSFPIGLRCEERRYDIFRTKLDVRPCNLEHLSEAAYQEIQ